MKEKALAIAFLVILLTPAMGPALVAAAGYYYNEVTEEPSPAKYWDD